MEEALREYLLAGAAVSALVGVRVHWVYSPQGSASPRIVLYRVGGLRNMRMSGPTGLVASRVQVDCIGRSYESAKTVARAAEARLSGYSGTHSGVVFQGCFLIAERDDYEDAETPDRLFRTSLDFNIWHKGA